MKILLPGARPLARGDADPKTTRNRTFAIFSEFPFPFSALVSACLASVWFVQPAGGQRIEFPTAIPTTVAPSASSAASTTQASNGATSVAPTYQPGPAPTFSPAPAPDYSTPPPSYGPGVAPGPAATLQGDIQPAPTWDPYGTPGAQQPTLLPEDPCLPGIQPYPTGKLETMRRFLQRVGANYVWMPGTSAEELGLSDFDFSATFAVPFLYNTQTPLLITPGFGLQLWNGPMFPLPVASPLTEFPARTYDAYLDAAWNPQATPLLGGELGARIGVYSDFEKVNSESVRVQGHGLAVLSFSPSFQIKAGVIYLDRQRIKILPAGGLIWTPNSDVRFDILFPNPKLAKRLTTYRNTDWWLYARGEYGGGSWTVSEIPVDYNDLRFGVGLEFDRFSGSQGLFEVGVAFDRELYLGGAPLFEPNSTVFLRGEFGY